MQFFILIIVFKIALGVLFLTLGAMFMADFFPILADKAVAAASGTVVAPIGEITADFLNFIAKYAQMFVDLVFGWLRAFGIDIDSGTMKEGVQDMNLEAPSKVEKPEF